MTANPNTQPSIFGTSLQLTSGDLPFLGGSFVVIEGRDNFLQVMQVMIETPFGSDIFNVNYGFDLLNAISQPQTAAQTKDLIRLNIVRSLSLDNRVREIKEIVFSDEPRFFEIAPGSNPEESHRARKTGRYWGAIIVLQTVDGNEAALRLQGPGI